ncbi:MAG TPA: class I SAM-dependent methyltransferase [Methylomirabilota bacterium]|nr:class I SAM-dependent methyltransferase [Methylomirabilota bacterium]
MTNSPPENWGDKDAWDRYFTAELSEGRTAPYPDSIVLRFLSFARKQGGRIWFPGCGLDPYPYTYAKRGCRALATDFSAVAIRYQQRLAAAFLKEDETAKVQSTFAIAEHDFTQNTPDGEFDVVINIHAFQGLSSSAMRAGAGHFYAALRPGGACIIDTINVQGNDPYVIEETLIAAGFYIPFHKSERWYRQQLDSTGIVYRMVLGRPHIPIQDQYPPEHFSELAKRDQQILDSFQVEYERRCQDEAAEVDASVNNPATIVAHVVYATG